MGFKELKKVWEEETNIEKKTGFKVYKPVFVAVLVLMVVLYAFAVIENDGFEKKFYAKCFLEPGEYCNNPFYDNEFKPCPEEYGEFCNVPVFTGEIGEAPGPIYKNYYWFVLGLLLLGFLVNVLLNKLWGGVVEKKRRS